ncbi:hypothetical protein HPB47_002759 [Ixodes persulcatus]|uniref:Uncharacterized protein n=1 Tax=Ixodes persulcatus TaxID=34615 RepID=A0AC60PLI6_IXOPE|nr:hypothetical protein HPB47_002759 [Ixodes persulcatus]
MDEGAHFVNSDGMPQQSNTFAVKIVEPEEIPPTQADESMYSDDCGRASTASLHRWVKEEPDESAFLQIHEGSCSGAFDCTSSTSVDVEEPWKDGRLHVVEGKLLLCFIFVRTIVQREALCGIVRQFKH